MKNYKVNKNTILINFLVNDLNLSHKEAKKKLVSEQIIVNNNKVTQYDFELKVGDTVTVNNFNSRIDNNIEIIYEDKNIIVVNKPENLLTIATKNEKDKTLYHLVSNYLKKINKNAKVFVIHRLDKETSGIVMFAKSEKIKNMYQNNWNELVKYRGYVAVIEGTLPKTNDTIVEYLKENDNFYVYATDQNNGKQAITKYNLIKSNKKYSLLDIEIKTGRKNQIRVAMKNLGHPIVGDKKYGSFDNSLKRLGLCAYKLVITNPIDNKNLSFEIKIPSNFIKIVN